jgi:hypothetical protein
MPLLCRLSPARSVSGRCVVACGRVEMSTLGRPHPHRVVSPALGAVQPAGPGLGGGGAQPCDGAPRFRWPLLGAVADSAMPFFLLRQPAFLALAWLLSRHPCPAAAPRQGAAEPAPTGPRRGHSQRTRGRVGHPGPECRCALRWRADARHMSMTNPSSTPAVYGQPHRYRCRHESGTRQAAGLAVTARRSVRVCRSASALPIRRRYR